MKREVVSSADAPRAIGPYSQAIKAGGFIFCSGQIALDLATGELVGGDAAAQARRVLVNLEAVLGAAGSSLRHVVKTTVYLRDLGDYAAVNAVYGDFFPEAPPARAALAAAGLPKGALVEIDAIATERV
ncbi:MAG: Rid family detoxifying hydrolase [Planctomycetota bacterium]